jgi:hypothetical protein
MKCSILALLVVVGTAAASKPSLSVSFGKNIYSAVYTPTSCAQHFFFHSIKKLFSRGQTHLNKYSYATTVCDLCHWDFWLSLGSRSLFQSCFGQKKAEFVADDKRFPTHKC